MRESLTALVEELRRLRGLGVRQLPVSEASVAALRAAVAARREPGEGGAPVAKGPEGGGERATLAGSAPAPRPAEGRRTASASAPASSLPPPPALQVVGDTPEARWQCLRALTLADPVAQAQLRPGKQLVYGVGHLAARLFLCGEAPGADEELAGEPFVGPAGQKLNQILTAMGLKREEVYIGNILSWRPRLTDQQGNEQVGNRPPSAEELAYGLPYLIAQLEIVQPKVIVALGSTAAAGLLGPGSFRTLGEVRGRWHEFRGVPVRVTYHPAYLLRQEELGAGPGKKAKRAVWEDLLQVMERLEMPISDKQRGYFL